MKVSEAVKWHDRRAKKWEKLRIGKYSIEKQEICIKTLKTKKGEHILDVGCGTGFFARNVAKNGAKVVALDMSENMLKVAKEIARKENLKIKFVKGNAEKLPFKNSSFDKLIAVDLIQHLNEPKEFIKEASRVVKKGGKIVLAWPHSKSLYRMKYYFEKLILQRNLPFTAWLPVSLVERWLKNVSFDTKTILTSLNITAIIVGEKL